MVSRRRIQPGAAVLLCGELLKDFRLVVCLRCRIQAYTAPLMSLLIRLLAVCPAPVLCAFRNRRFRRAALEMF